MEKFIINPENYRQQYIDNLNQCFNGWGGEKEYEWAFNRKIGTHSTDIILIENEEDGVIAGSAVSYRTLRSDDREIEIGIMTGSWTLPAARRKGCFSKMIDCSRELCRKKNVPFLTAFVTEENASSRRLASAGSYMYPSFHLFSPNQPYKDGVTEPEELSKNDKIKRDIFQKWRENQKEYLHFTYSFEEFSSQYLERVKEAIFLKIGNDYAVLEDGVNEVKVLMLTYSNRDSFKEHLKSLTNWCLQNIQKKAFYYTTVEDLHDAAKELGFENGPGYFTILPAFEEASSPKEKFSGLRISMADKM